LATTAITFSGNGGFHFLRFFGAASSTTSG